MKKFFLLNFLLLSLIAKSQVSIKITVGSQSKVEFSQDKDSNKENNEIIIENQFEQDSCTVSLRTLAPSTFIFGKGGQKPLKKGTNSFQFNSSGTVRDYPVKK